PDDNPQATPLNRWRSHAHLLYGNWISEIYLTTPYDSDTLKQEYDRDLDNVQVDGADIAMPVSYFPDDNPQATPLNRWRSHAHLLYGNWISEIYLTTPYDMSRIGQEKTDLRG
ncbi:MAG: homoserine O-succinyltransferase, partial [Pseudomonadota bacterium]